jgi:hypothetical protein
MKPGQCYDQNNLPKKPAIIFTQNAFRLRKKIDNNIGPWILTAVLLGAVLLAGDAVVAGGVQRRTRAEQVAVQRLALVRVPEVYELH